LLSLCAIFVVNWCFFWNARKLSDMNCLKHTKFHVKKIFIY